MNELFHGQLESTLGWTGHPGLDDEFMAALFPGGILRDPSGTRGSLSLG